MGRTYVAMIVTYSCSSTPRPGSSEEVGGVWRHSSEVGSPEGHLTWIQRNHTAKCRGGPPSKRRRRPPPPRTHTHTQRHNTTPGMQIKMEGAMPQLEIIVVELPLVQILQYQFRTKIITIVRILKQISSVHSKKDQHPSASNIGIMKTRGAV